MNGADWVSCARTGPVSRDRAVVGLSLDTATMAWPVVVAARTPGGAVSVRMVGIFDSLDAASSAASGAAGSACTLLVPSHALRGQVRVPGLPAPMHLQESDALSALSLAPVSLRAGALIHDPADGALSEAVLAVPAKRVARRWDAGTLALVCAWWAGKQQPRAVGA